MQDLEYGGCKRQAPLAHTNTNIICMNKGYELRYEI